MQCTGNSHTMHMDRKYRPSRGSDFEVPTEPPYHFLDQLATFNSTYTLPRPILSLFFIHILFKKKHLVSEHI